MLISVHRVRWFATLLIVVVSSFFEPEKIFSQDVDFLRDVRPLLVSRCYRCHSSLKQEGGLRLDSPEALSKGGENGPIMIPGKSQESRLLAAVRQVDGLKMPPEGEPLKPAEIDLMRRWIDAGAKMPKGDEIRHWSFVPPQRTASPIVRRTEWPKTSIDAWMAARHEAAGLSPAPAASKQVFLRRLMLDLVGLPPSDDELREFLADESPDAVERTVDRLLAQPAHGERWGRHWMDVWRYSDWDGYGAEVRESQPHIWRWRDWIIEAINADKPYQQMVVEMLAGDELAPNDPQTLRATGFLVRNWFKFNRNVWLDNTIEHTGKAFVGLTFNCARCHDHMYDPMSQAEYYQLRAIFEPYDVRTDPVPGQTDVAKDGLVRAYDAKLDVPTFLFTRGDEKQPEKERPLAAGLPRALTAISFQPQPVPLAPDAYYPGSRNYVHAAALADAHAERQKAEATIAEAQQKLAAARTKLAEFIAARNASANVPTPPVNNPAPSEPPANQANLAETLSDDFAKPRPELWNFGLGKWDYRDGKLVQSESLNGMCQAVASKPLPRDFQATLRFRTTGGKVYKSVGISFDVAGEQDFQFVYASAYEAGPKLQYAWRDAGKDNYPATAARTIKVDLAQVHELQVTVRSDLLNASFDGLPPLAVRLPVARRSEGKFALWTYDATAEFEDVRITSLPANYKFVEPSAQDAAAASASPMPASPPSEASLQTALQAAEAALADGQQGLAVAQANVVAVTARIAADEAHYQTPPAANAKELAIAAVAAERQVAVRKAERTLLQAQQKLATVRATATANDEKSKKSVTDAEAQVTTAQKANDAAVAAVAQPNEAYTRFGAVYATSSTGRRLTLARWIASDDNPLTPRVAVNHLWLRHLGSPLVASMFDFGANGQRPSHPELLDALARELVDGGWEMKRLHRQIVTSATYRQASSIPAAAESAAAKIDPENRLLWRMNVRRMEAELVRDATLFVADELDRRMYGPELDPAAGLTLPRRSLYFRLSKEKKMTFLSLFDSANVSECYRRSESIAPQQALALANSGLALSQSRRLAARLAAETQASPANHQSFIAAAFQRVLGRPATTAELTECETFLTQQAARFQQAGSLTPFGGPSDSVVKPSADPLQRARENLVHVLLNHNDFVAIR